MHTVHLQTGEEVQLLLRPVKRIQPGIICAVVLVCVKSLLVHQFLVLC